MLCEVHKTQYHISKNVIVLMFFTDETKTQHIAPYLTFPYLPKRSAIFGPTSAPISPPMAVIDTVVDHIKSVIVTLRLIK